MQALHLGPQRNDPALVSNRPRPELPLLERFATRLLQRAPQRSISAPLDPVHVLNPEERAGVRRVERAAIVRAGLAGVVNAILTGLGELWALPLLGPNPDLAIASQRVTFWLTFGLAAFVAAVLEIGYLYWDALRAIRELAGVAGLPLSQQEDDEVALALARAALELPTPPHPVMGVDPHREASRVELVVASLVYKLKITVTNFLFKALLRRALGRAVTRAFLAFAAIPVNAAWNVAVCWLVLREARIRVMGPSAAEEVVRILLDHRPSLSEKGKLALHRAVASAIVRTRELHPNLIALMRSLRTRIGDPPAGAVLDESKVFLASLSELETGEAKIVLAVLTAAAVLDGRLVRNERRLLVEARRHAGLSPDLAHARRLRRAFVAGEPIAPEEVLATARP
jgi:hypothetical protein